MKILTAFLVVIGLAVVVAAAIPILSIGLVLAVACGGFFIWLLPMLIIAVSDKTTAGEKAAWILAILFLSWFAWIFYFLLAPLKEKPGYGDYRREYRYRYRYD